MPSRPLIARSSARVRPPGAWALSAFAWLAPIAASQIPPPADTPCEVIVSGRTTTLKSIVIRAVAQHLPATYSATVKNTPGMSWFVSQHYALKTDHDEATARRYLTYAELAYPQQVWIVGRTPPDQGRLRMPFVMGSTYDRMLDAIETDGGWRPKDIGGGGITYWGMNTAYNYPSGTLQYHQRDLVLHENLHLLQMCCGGARTTLRLREGVTYTSSNHVYDDQAQRLTLAVFDKPTINSPTTDQLRDVQAHFRTFRRICAENSHIALFTSFLWSDPERLLGWRAWRDAMLFGGRNDQDLQVMEEVFGPLDGPIESAWKKWVTARRATFRYRDWGWEQSGDALIAYGWPQRGPYSRTDVLLPPGDEPSYDPLRMDYPLQPASDLVGPVHRGGAEPAVGALIGFRHTSGHALAGIGLGVEPQRPIAELAYLPLLVRADGAFLIHGEDLGLPDETRALSSRLKAAMAASGHRLGLTARIGEHELEVTLRARDPAADAAVRQVFRWPLDHAQRARLLADPGTLLARDGRPAITPYFDDARRPEPDLSVPAPPNRWRFAGFEQLEGLYRARLRLGATAPASLVSLEERMLGGVDADPATQAEVIRAYAARIEAVVRDVRACDAATPARAEALGWLGRVQGGG